MTRNEVLSGSAAIAFWIGVMTLGLACCPDDVTLDVDGGSVDARALDAAPVDAMTPPDVVIPPIPYDAPPICPPGDAGGCGLNCQPCCLDGDAGYFCLEGGCDSIGGPENRICLL